jgi:hypothetical protein
MLTLEPRSLATFLNRFSSFNDAVLRTAEFRFRSSSNGKRRSIVTLSAQDHESGQGWSNVKIVIEEVSEFVLQEGKATCQILSDGLFIKWFGDVVFVLFSGDNCEPVTIDDFRRSTFYVAGRSFSWEASVYSEE